MRSAPWGERGRVQDKFGISLGTVRAIAKEFDVPTVRASYSDDDRREVCRLYSEGALGIDEITAATGCSRPTIYAILENAGISLRSGKDRVKFSASPTAYDMAEMYVDREISLQRIAYYYACSVTAVKNAIEPLVELRLRGARRRKDLDEQILGLFAKGYTSITEIRNRLTCDWHHVKKVLQSAGIDTDPRGYQPIYDINHEFFRDLACENSAYFAGVAEADFHNDRYTRRLAWSVKTGDEDLMLTFLQLIGYGGRPVRWVHPAMPHRRASSISWNSRAMSDDLAKLGILSLAPEERSFPSHLPRRTLQHYVRGFIDGDGSWAWQGTTLRVNFVAYRRYLEGLRGYLNSEFGLRSNSITRVHPTGLHSITFNGGDARAIRDFVYSDATVFLERKRMVSSTEGLRNLESMQRLESSEAR
jgi:hypothetical protein